MEIKDREGKVWPINDVENTIAMVIQFLSYEPSSSTASLQRLDEQRLNYWQDFLDKLYQLQNELNT